MGPQCVWVDVTANRSSRIFDFAALAVLAALAVAIDPHVSPQLSLAGGLALAIVLERGGERIGLPGLLPPQAGQVQLGRIAMALEGARVPEDNTRQV